ncbi:PREDICTED: nucleolar MIF4G domain-containing protein 1 [Tarenaya hassleriana]|uniref:nucleolar MIF4G domain-containing protein 1 n=1 Tax=Tarenaya hassleriana TaxID=28532 RepID=UPI00053C5689|nr:PREDICTED: nucleolar MIF4G domain-containing protein 1 [Tarenaya hassleriana]
MGNSRHDKRKEARLEKSRLKHETWLQRQRFQKGKKLSLTSKTINSEDIPVTDDKETVHLERENSPASNEHVEQTFPVEIAETEVKSKEKKIRKANSKKDMKKGRKTKFEEYLEIDTPKAFLSGQEDLELERRLAKKLRVKEGKLGGSDDGINELFGGFPSALCSLGVKRSKSGKKRKKKSSEEGQDSEVVDKQANDVSEHEELCFSDDSLEDIEPVLKPCKKKRLPKEESESHLMAMDDSDPSETVSPESLEETMPRAESSTKYIAPHLRSRAGSEPEEHTQTRRRVRGLLNRMTESNVESITAELSSIYRTVARSVASQIFCEEVLASCANGPRGNEQYASVFAAFIAGMACSVGMDFSAKLMAMLAKSFEDEYQKEDNLSLRNVTLLLSYLCIFGVCSSDLVYDFLMTLGKRLTEVDVSTILHVLHCCGMKMRSDDPLAMKNFIISIQNRANELKTSSEGQEKINTKRMEFMLETICEIKNNKKRPKEDTVQHTRIKKWLQKLRVEEVLLRGLSWSKLLDPEKKGQWWLSGDLAASSSNHNTEEELAKTIDKEALEAQKMLKLAASQRMNTDARKAIFCVIMSGEDYIDAFEKLLRLDLPGKQDREIMRVLVECCLQEKAFNKYYTVLASKLCEHDKNHKFTLQYCIWDHFKEVESMSLQRSMHLAKFVAEMIASFTLSLAVLKSVDLANPNQLTPKRIMHFRMLFEAIFEHPENIVWNVFTRISLNPDYEPLREGIKFFAREYVVKKPNKASFRDKFTKAKEALHNSEGFLM